MFWDGFKLETTWSNWKLLREINENQWYPNEIHEQFIAVVKEGRGERLANDPQIFSGLFWDGNSAIKLGLVDNLGSIRSVARDIVGNENIIDFTTKASFGERLAEKFGAGIGTSFSSTIINKIKNNTVIK